MWLQVFGRDAFGQVGKYFRALRFTCEGEGKHKLVGHVAVPASCLQRFPSALRKASSWQKYSCQLVYMPHQDAYCVWYGQAVPTLV